MYLAAIPTLVELPRVVARLSAGAGSRNPIAAAPYGLPPGSLPEGNHD